SLPSGLQKATQWPHGLQNSYRSDETCTTPPPLSETLSMPADIAPAPLPTLWECPVCGWTWTAELDSDTQIKLRGWGYWVSYAVAILVSPLLLSALVAGCISIIRWIAQLIGLSI